ncbi:MAG: hypothetical protein MUO31_13920 [Thermodesulfovibrionales bacterium]|nr:hypothetical protein [Thermodesulfovibrionales bacterium]
MPETNDIKEVRKAYFQEYTTLRQESLQSMGNRNQIITFGLGSIGLLIAATLSASTDALIAKFIPMVFNIIVPIISILIYIAWFAEFERMVRAGKYIQHLEDAINRTLVHDALSWEHDLEKMRMGYAYFSVFALFLGIAVVSPFLSLIYLQDKDPHLSILMWIQEVFSGNSKESLQVFSNAIILKTPIISWGLTLVVALFTLIRTKCKFKKFTKRLPLPNGRDRSIA